MSVQVPYHKQFAIGLILFLVFLLTIELIAQAYLSQDDSCYQELEQSEIYVGKSEKFLKQICDSYHSLLYYNTDQELRFPIKYFEPNQYLENISINNQGIRGQEISNEKPDNIFRIFVVGGSTAFGNWASSDSTTIPGNLRSMMEQIKTDKEIEVYNLGVFGRTSFEEIHDLKQNFLRYEPDLIIVYDGWNDLYQNFNQFEEGKTTSYLTNLSKLYQILIRNYATFGMINGMIESLQMQNGIHPDAIPDSENMQIKADAWVENWDDMCQIGKQQNFDVIIFLQPVLGTGDKLLSEWEKHILETKGYTSVVPYYHYMQAKIPILNEKCTAAYDISEIFNSVNKPVYISMGHTGDFGYKIVADEIFNLTEYYLTKELPNNYRQQIFLNSIGDIGNDEVEFNAPHGIDFFGNELFVLDCNNCFDGNKIRIFSSDGIPLSKFSIGTKCASGIAATNEKIFVADTCNYGIKSFDYNGNFLNEFGVSWTRDLEADEEFVYVMEPHQAAIQVYNHNGELVDKLHAHNNLHYLNSYDNKLIASGPHPTVSISPEIMIFDKERKIVDSRFSISDNAHGAAMLENHAFLIDGDKIQIFDLKGELLSEFNLEKNSEESFFTQIEVNNDILYVLDTHGSNIQILEIIYE